MSDAPNLRLEQELFNAGHLLVAGMDEVGRGAFGGPVSVGVCLVSSEIGDVPVGLRDSKQLTAKLRQQILPELRSWWLSATVGDASAAEIDELGIVGALRLAGNRALQQLPQLPQMVILDGKHNWLTPPASDLFDQHESISVPVTMLVKADQSCASVAAASVLAKVHRDQLMADLETDFPGYGWAEHVGYGTPAHRAAIAKLGLSAVHRKSWRIEAD